MTIAFSVRRFLDALLHPSARYDAMMGVRQRLFIGVRLFGSFTILACFPLYIGLRGVPEAIEVAVFAWLIVPILIAYFLSRTGDFESAHGLSAVALAGVTTAIAFNTGGISSFAAVWLVVVPIETALSTSRRAVVLSVVFSLGCALFLVVAEWNGRLPSSVIPPHLGAIFEALGITSVVLYCAALAFIAEMLGSKSRRLLNAEEKRYRLLARNMSDVITRHRRNGAIEFISPAAQTLFDAPCNDLMGHGLFDRVHVADRPAYLTALADVANGASERDVEFRVKLGSVNAGVSVGTTVIRQGFVWIEMRCRPLDHAAPDAPSTNAEVVAVMRDVTERKAQEAALDAAHAEAEKAHAAKGQFLATMSHELRTPLNAIIGFSEMIAQEKELGIDAQRRQEYAKLINDSGQHLLSVVNSILDISKMESGGFEILAEPFDPREAILSCSNLMALKARDSGVDLIVAMPEELPSMVGDRRALKQILLNLMSNAIKFTESAGAVTVSAVAEHGKLVLRVADTGVGISAEDLKRVGDPFFQTEQTYRRRHEGTGLGLSIVKSLVSLHDGQMTIQSKVDEGTTISIVLPLDLDQPVSKPAQTITTLTPRQNEKSEQKVRKSA